MQLFDAENLIRCEALTHATAGASWADLGCGSGLFSHALATLLPAGSTIYAVDRANTFNPHLRQNQVNPVIPLLYDFVQDQLPLSNLDGILMANALHYVADKPALLDRLQDYLKPEAHLLIVEYDTDVPVPVWVPYPANFVSLSALLRSKGFRNITKLQERPSLFRSSNIYAAIAQR